ncbi:mediator of RNA polymerase II transcription subunit 28-like [Oppia nitens]|uniref:mediator of RNA polymerase II transcription subunit 28-like n=1 Tax=Oppia nitens TaxID=1686743 RepID=UPI0023D97EEE|nr:mediator of RNA polymerase II transcription subunit 28-like [Oppia nitens]
MTTNSTSLIDDFENSFQSCLSLLTNPSTTHIHDSDEVKTSVDQNIQRFLDIGRQIEAFFLQKRLLISVQKPEQILAEDIMELKNEIARKDQVLTKYYDKLQYWQQLMNETVANGDGSHHLQRPTSLTGQPVAAQPPQQLPLQMASPHPQINSQMNPQLRHSVQSPISAINGPPTMMRPSMGPQMTVASAGPMTPPQMIPSGPMQGQTGMMTTGQPTNMGPMMTQMGAQQGMQQIGGQSPMPTQQMPQFMPQPPQPGLQGPLAFLERTTSNIGLSDARR